jgi:hypothetical protein
LARLRTCRSSIEMSILYHRDVVFISAEQWGGFCGAAEIRAWPE